MFIIKKITALITAFVLGMTMFTACSFGQDKQQPDQPEVKPMDYNYLTGLPFDDGQDKSARPVAVMINNAKIALPQYGLMDADVIYEAVTEGGITRLMALYSDMNKITRTGPVRSARTQFVELMLPLNAIYVHIGSSTTADSMLNNYAYQDVDGIYLGSLAFFYDSELAKTKPSEHCWFTTKELIQAGIDKTGIVTKNSFYPAFDFVYHEGEVRQLTGNAANHISYAYSNYADVAFNYDVATGTYLKNAFGTPHMDAGYNTQVGFDNVFVLVANVGIEVENGVLPDFDYSRGTGYYFCDGKMEEITWQKGNPENPLVLYAADGQVLKVNTGRSYVGMLGADMLGTLVISEQAQTTVEVDRVQ